MPGGTINQYGLDREAKVVLWIKSNRRGNILREAVQFSNEYTIRHFIGLHKQISKMLKSQVFGILNFGHCDLFGICILLFEIFYDET